MVLKATSRFRAKRRSLAQLILVLLLSVCLPHSLYAFDFAHWDAILKKNTRSSNFAAIEYTGFDYAAIRNSSEFDRLIEDLASFSPEELRGKDETIAFWINVYNIFAVKMVRDHFPISGIKEIGSIFSPVWSIPAGNVGGKMRTLHSIEHEILRTMNEPAIHFAIVCASVSCPDLLPEAYTAATLKSQMKGQVNRFLANGAKGLLIDDEKKKVHISKIFNWYEEDFAEAGGIIGFLNRELGAKRNIPADYAVEYLPYNWDLNAVR